MALKSGEERVTRRASNGALQQWSNAQERPDGFGWQQASKASYPHARTYLWFRDASNIELDRRKSEQSRLRAASIPAPVSLASALFRPFHYMKQRYDQIMQKQGIVPYPAHSRVFFGSQPYYTVGAINNEDQTIKIKNPVSGEVKTVNAKELSPRDPDVKPYAIGDKVVLAKGSIDSAKEHEAMIIGMDKLKGTYIVSLSAVDPKQRDIKDKVEVYPEAIDAYVPGKLANNPNIEITEFALTDMDERRVLETLSRAHRSGRNSVQLKEIISDLKAHGHPVSEGTVVYTLATLNRVDPNIQYNANSGGVYIGAGENTLKQLMRMRNVSPEEGKFGALNLVQEGDKDTYAHAGQRVKGDGVSGVIQDVIGDIATILTGEPGGKKTSIQLKLDELKDEFNRTLHIDPGAPKYVGNVRNKDIFWVLRDREGIKTVKEGDSVALLPGISNLKANKDQPLSGRVVAVNNDGTVDMETTVGGKLARVRAFNRQLEKTPQLESVGAFQDYLFMHRKSVPGRTLKVNDTEVVFGSAKDKSVTLNFANGEDYATNEHIWFTPIAAQSNPSSWESVINGLGSIWGKSGDFSTTLAPSKTMLSAINEVYPGARFVVIARDTTTTPEQINGVKGRIKFKVTVDKEIHPITNPGKRYNLDRLYETCETRKESAPIPASALGESNNIRIETDGDSVYIKLGRLFKEYRAPHLSAIARHETEVEKLKGKRLAKYEEEISRPPTMFDAVDSTMYNRRTAWGTDADGMKLADLSSVLTYDSTNDRYVAGLEHYDDVHEFLKKFFGERAYDSNAFETENRGYYAHASDKILSVLAAKHQRELKEQLGAKHDINPLEIKGFYQGPKSVVLRPYQNAAVRFMLKNNATLLAMDQGTGKSLSAIAATVEKLNKMDKEDPSRKHRALIIAPASVAQTSWMGDLDRSIVTKDRAGNVIPGRHNYTLLMGKDRVEGYKRLADNNDNTSIAVTSYNTFALKDWLEARDMGFDVVVLDEAQAISGADNAGIITDHLQMMLKDVPQKIALTGTPLENDPSDLQAALAWLKPETFGDKQQFMNDFVDTDYTSTPSASGRASLRKVGVRLKNLRALRSKLGQIMFRVEKDDLVSTEYNNPNTYSIRYDAAHPEKFNDLVKKYKSPETDEVSRTRIGELSIVPMRTLYPMFKKDEPFTKGKDGRIHLNLEGAHSPLTMDAYPEYEAQISRAKDYMRADYLRRLHAGERPNMQSYIIRLQQAMNDPSLLARTYGAEFDHYVPNPKMDKLVNLVSNHFSSGGFSNKPEQGKIIIFAEHVETIKFLEKRLVAQFPQLRGKLLKFIGQGHADVMNQAGMKTRQNIQDAFNNDPKFEYPIMLANNAAKTGINLPAANMVINYDIGWNPQDINQRIDRAHRVRSLKDVVASKTAPARNVTAHSLVVTDADGDINSTVEAKKLFSHKVKERIFDTLVRGKQEPDQSGVVSLPDEDFQQIGEDLLGVTNKELELQGTPRVDLKRADEQVQRRRADKKRRAELEKQYGDYARFQRDYPREPS